MVLQGKHSVFHNSELHSVLICVIYKIIHSINWPLELLHGLLRSAEIGLSATEMWERIHTQLVRRQNERGPHWRYASVESVIVGDVREAWKDECLKRIFAP